MELRLGFFPDFKSADSVLLSGSPNAMGIFVEQLGAFVTSPRTEMPIHDLALVSSAHPAQLFAVRSSSSALGGFRWLCSDAEFETIRDKLQALAGCTAGHQYFEFVSSDCQLVVSVGEYDDAWWGQYG